MRVGIFVPIERRIEPRAVGLMVLGGVALALLAYLLAFGENDAGARAGKEAGVSGVQVPSNAPVVEVVLDELPTATLMNAAGTRINRKRFPGFAKLAAHSTWYRNNSTVADFTGRAVPAIETGINPGYDQLPVASEHPNSIFTLLGGEYRFNVSEPVTRVCPASLCPRHNHGRADTSKLTAGEFAQSAFAPPKPSVFRRWLKHIRSGRRSFNFIHFEIPHEPFHFLPDGRSYNYTPISDVGNHNAQRWAGGVGGTATTWQRHYIQTGYGDTLIKRVIRRMKKVGIWKRALLIVTADHGISFDPKEYRRLAQQSNLGGIANPPLFIKYPGQTRGEVSDIHTRTIDIVPTTARALGFELPYQADGVPIDEDGFQGPITITNGFENEFSAPLSDMVAQREVVVRKAAEQLGSHTGLFRLGPQSELLGRRARATRVAAPRAAVDGHLDLGDVNIAPGRKVPAFVNGTVGAAAAGKVIAIGVNGRIVATCRAFRFKGRTRWGAVVPPSKLHDGGNSVSIYLVRANRLVRLG